MNREENEQGYEDFPDSIFFGEFNPDRWAIHEDTVLRPQLEREGFYAIHFVFDNDGPIERPRRVCICTDKDGILRKLVY